MKKIRRLVMEATAMSITIFALSLPLQAQKSHKEASKKAQTEMMDAFGTVPMMMKAMPDHLRTGAWEWYKSTMSPDSPIPAKYSELISLGVASQIPCVYCVYAHATMARMLGATDAEIKAAVAGAANTRHWSTILNGSGADFEKFKAEWDGILMHIKKQKEAKVTTKR